MNNSGPYSKAKVLVYDNGEASLEYPQPRVLINSSDTIHTVKDGENIHSIAYQYYKDSGKWYIIAEANHISNPFREINPGTKLIIPRNGF